MSNTKILPFGRPAPLVLEPARLSPPQPERPTPRDERPTQHRPPSMRVTVAREDESDDRLFWIRPGPHYGSWCCQVWRNRCRELLTVTTAYRYETARQCYQDYQAQIRDLLNAGWVIAESTRHPSWRPDSPSSPAWTGQSPPVREVAAVRVSVDDMLEAVDILAAEQAARGKPPRE